MKRYATIIGSLWVIALSVARPASASPPADRLISKIAFGSCARQEQPQPIWDKIVGLRPHLFLFIGDNIYGDSEDMEVLKAKYAKLAAVPGFARLRESCTLLATWDDHDYGVNDGGRELPQRDASQRVFLDFFRDPPDSVRRHRPGVYISYVFGPAGKRVQIILLDTRYFRSPLKPAPKPASGPLASAATRRSGGHDARRGAMEMAGRAIRGAGASANRSPPAFRSWPRITAGKNG